MIARVDGPDRARRRRDSRRARDGARSSASAKGVAYADTIGDRRAVRRIAAPRPAIRCAAAASTRTSPIRASSRSRASSSPTRSRASRTCRWRRPSTWRRRRGGLPDARAAARARAAWGFFREGTHELCDARATRQLLPATCDVLDRLVVAMRDRSASPTSARSSCPKTSTRPSASFTSTRRSRSAARSPIGGVSSAVEGFGAGRRTSPTVLAIDGHPPIALRRHVLAFFQGNRFLLRRSRRARRRAGAAGQRRRSISTRAPGCSRLRRRRPRAARVTAVEGRSRRRRRSGGECRAQAAAAVDAGAPVGGGVRRASAARAAGRR